MSEEQTKKNIEMFTIYGRQEEGGLPILFNKLMEYNRDEDPVSKILNSYPEVYAIYLGRTTNDPLIYKKGEK